MNLQRRPLPVGRQFDPRFEDNPAYVRDPGNYQENNDSGQTNAVPFDPQALPHGGRNELPLDAWRQIMRILLMGA